MNFANARHKFMYMYCILYTMQHPSVKLFLLTSIRARFFPKHNIKIEKQKHLFSFVYVCIIDIQTGSSHTSPNKKYPDLLTIYASLFQGSENTLITVMISRNIINIYPSRYTLK